MVCPEGLVASVSAAAVAIAKGKKPDEVNLLAVVFTQLGDTLATISAAREFCEAKREDSKTTA